MSKLINSVIGNQFKVSPDSTVVAVQCGNQKTYTQLKDDEKLTEEDKRAILEVKYNVQEYVKAQILEGSVILTTINCYDVCAFAIKTLREERPTDGQGGLVILGSKSELNSSGLIDVIKGTPNCFYVEVASQKGTDEEEKAITEEYNAYKEAYKLRKEENPDSEEEKLTRVSFTARLNMLKWKLIADVCDMALIFDTNYHSAVSKSNFLVRNLLGTGTPAYVYVGKNPAREATFLVKPASYRYEVPTFKDTDVIDYSVTEFTNMLLGAKNKVKYEPTHMYTAVDSEALQTAAAIEDISISGLINSATKDKIQAIYVPAYTDEYIEAYRQEHPDIEKAWNLVDDKLSLIRSGAIKEQLQTLIETSLESDKTVMLVADSAYGVSALEVAYRVLAKQKGIPTGQVVILVGDIQDTYEGNLMNAYVDRLESFPNVGLITSNKASFKTSIPNLKPIEERKEDEKDTINVTLPAYAALTYISSSLAGEVISLSDVNVSVEAKYPRYYAALAGTEYQDFKLKNINDTYFSRKPSPKLTKSARIEAIEGLVDIKKFVDLFKNGMKEKVDSGVRGF